MHGAALMPKLLFTLPVCQDASPSPQTIASSSLGYGEPGPGAGRKAEQPATMQEGAGVPSPGSAPGSRPVTFQVVHLGLLLHRAKSFLKGAGKLGVGPNLSSRLAVLPQHHLLQRMPAARRCSRAAAGRGSGCCAAFAPCCMHLDLLQRKREPGMTNVRMSQPGGSWPGAVLYFVSKAALPLLPLLVPGRALV